jgi:Ca2+-binding RTX toxin-like protein
VTTTITCYFTIDNKSPCWVVCISNITQINNAVDLAKLGGDSKYTIDYLGDENANTLTGTRSDEIFVAGAGNDILTGNSD